MNLQQLPYKSSRAIIINCSTKLFSILALASVLRNTDLDVLVVDCESTDGSLELFLKIKDTYKDRVEIVQLPLKPHGTTLDLIFNYVDSDYLLLVDSDLEVLTPEIYKTMLNEISGSNAYGSGLIHSGDWMKKSSHNVADGTTYYMERMWIPFTLLKVKVVRDILASGVSFLAKKEYGRLLLNKSVSSFLSKRFRIPWLRNYPKILCGNVFNNENPSVTEFDTGAHVHETAKHMGYTFKNIPAEFYSDVYHFDGVTRAKQRNYFRALLLRVGVLSEEVENNLTDSENSVLVILKEKYPNFLVD